MTFKAVEPNHQKIKEANLKAKESAERKKKRSSSEESNYVQVDNKKRKKKDDRVVRPKKFISAYHAFIREQSLKASGKEKNAGSGSPLKHWSSIWQRMTDDEKRPYEVESNKDKLRKEREDRELEQQGYFTLKDGTKSTDLKPKPKPEAPKLGVKRCRGRPRKGKADVEPLLDNKEISKVVSDFKSAIRNKQL